MVLILLKPGLENFECTSHHKHPLPRTQEKTLHMEITKWSILKSNWLYSLQPKMETLYTVSKNKTGGWCGSGHELLIAKFRRKLNKVGKTTRPFTYDLNQIPYNYTGEMTNRFQGLDLRDSVPEELYRRQWSTPSPKKCRKAKMVFEEALKIAEKRRQEKSKRYKERYSHLNAEFQRIARRSKKAFLSNQCKVIEKNNRWKN